MTFCLIPTSYPFLSQIPPRITQSQSIAHSILCRTHHLHHSQPPPNPSQHISTHPYITHYPSPHVRCAERTTAWWNRWASALHRVASAVIWATSTTCSGTFTLPSNTIRLYACLTFTPFDRVHSFFVAISHIYLLLHYSLSLRFFTMFLLMFNFLCIN